MANKGMRVTHAPTVSAASLTASDYAAASKAPSTRREYAKDVSYFLKQGGKLPATPAVVVNWLTAVAEILAPATIQRRLIAIHVWHQDHGVRSPTKDVKVKKVYAGICRTVGTKQRTVKPLVRDDLLAVLVTVDQQKPVKAARDAALLLLAFCSAMRRSELADVKLDDITVHSSGIDIAIRRSKTDRLGKGRVVSVPKGVGERCPVKAIANWIEVSAITSGYLLRSVNQHEQVGSSKLDVGSICRIVKHAVSRSGRDPSEYSSHSARAGYVTSAALAGIPTFQIAQVTGHRGLQSLQKYLRVIEQRQIPSLI